MKTVLFNGHDIVLFVIIYACLLFALFTLLVRRDAGWMHLWLGFFFLAQAGLAAYVLALYGAAFHSWTITHAPSAFAVLEACFWVEGPLLLLYTRAALYQRVRFHARDLVLLVPVVIYVFTLIGVSITYDSGPLPKFLQFLRSDHIQYYEHVRNFIRAGFGIWAFLIIQRYQTSLTGAYSNVESLSYGWLKFLVAGYAVLRLWSEFYLSLFTVIHASMGDSQVAQVDFDLMGITANYGQLLLISTLVYFGFTDSRQIVRIGRETLDSIEDTLNSTTEESTENRPDYTEEQVSRVKNHMDKARPFLDSQLKIDDLAHQLSLPPKLLSKLINREFKMNFYEYVNKYRLEEVKAYLQSSDMSDQSIIDLAFKAGFNSKTSFNRLFKQETGVTPTQYRKQPS